MRANLSMGGISWKQSRRASAQMDMMGYVPDKALKARRPWQYVCGRVARSGSARNRRAIRAG